jgi:hypothetical protein
MTVRTRLAASAALAAMAVTAASCSTKLSAQAPPSTTVAPTTTVLGAATPAQTKAADYRAQVTYLLLEQVFLLSRVTGGAVAAGSAAPLATTTAPAAAPTSTTTTTAPSTSTTTTTAAPATSETTTTSVPTSASSTTTTAGPAAASASTTTTAPAPTGPVAVLSAPNGQDAATALDHNSNDLTDLLAQPQGYGPTFASRFYPLWTTRNNDFIRYSAAKATKNAAGASSASAALTANALALANLFHSHNKYLAVSTVSNPGTGVADVLTVANTAEIAFINSQAAKVATAINDVVAAAEKMRHTSDVLSSAAAKLDPAQYPGTALGTASNLRAAVTAALVEHAELAGSTTALLATSQDAAAEAAALDANTSSLANVVIVNFFDQATRVFTAIWGNYVNLLKSYARAKASAGPTPNLSGVGEQVGGFFGHQAPTINPSLIASDMQQVVNGLVAVIDAQAAPAPWATAQRVATGFTPKLASDLSEGIAESNPTKYAP